MNKIKHILLVAFLICSSVIHAQGGGAIVTGKVYADDEPEGFIGATVIETDKNGRIYSSALTDFNGNFSLKVKNPANSLSVSYVGYKKRLIPIGDKRKFDIKLELKNELKEVTVRGTKMVSGGGLSIPEREYSGAMQKFNTKAIEGMSVASIDDALQGRIAGLDIVANSGDLGSGTVMRIRGITSINSNSQPLILVNDIPFESNIDDNFDFASADQEEFASLLSISPDDIEEITVLKDGAAAAIWGARGANGVINIVTKKGVTGPTRLNYSYRFSGHKQPSGTDLLSGDDYTMLMKQAYFNRSQLDCNIPEFSYDKAQFVNAYGTSRDFENFNNNTDWVEEVSKMGFTHDHNLSVNGGGEKAKFRVALGYYKQTGTIIGQELTRFSNRMNFEYAVSSRLRFFSEVSITYTDNDKNYSDDATDNLLDIARKKMPNVSIYRQDQLGRNTDVFFNIDPSSQLNDDQKNLKNPIAVAELAKYQQTSMRIMPTLRLQYDLMEPTNDSKLRYSGYVKFDSENVKDTKFLPRAVSAKGWNDESVNRSYSKESEAVSIYTNHDITWQPKLGEGHSLMLYGAWQMDMSNSKYQEFERYGLASTYNTAVESEGHLKSFGGGRSEGRNMAFLLRGHYFLLDRYILDVTARWDGSSRFGPGHRWGFFPAVSGKWLISSEPFFQFAKDYVSEFALRLGWGVTGNRPDAEYLHYSRYNNYGSNYIDIPTIKPSSLQLTNLKWERSTSYNLGIDLNMFDYRYRLVANIYHRRTEDLLFKDQLIPTSTGFGSISYINAGTMDNDGWELEFSTDRAIKAGDWTVDFSMNLSNYVNTVVNLDEGVLAGYNKDFERNNGSYLTRLQINNSFGSIYGFRYKGVYQYDTYQEDKPNATAPYVRDVNGNVVRDGAGKPVPMYFAYGTTNEYRFRGGDAIYEDINHDGTIDELDIVYLGNSNPKIEGGFGTTIRYKRFTLNAFFNYRVGNKIINKGRMNAENMYGTDNQSVATNWRWRKDGDLTEIPRALYQSGYNWLGSDRYVENGSFLRFKQLTLSYNFDPALLKKAHLNALNLSLTLNNLFTVTKYTGADPEISPNNLGISIDENRTPRSRYFTFGLTIGI